MLIDEAQTRFLSRQNVRKSPNNFTRKIINSNELNTNDKVNIGLIKEIDPVHRLLTLNKLITKKVRNFKVNKLIWGDLKAFVQKLIIGVSFLNMLHDS